jgi:hypothetical protein
MVVIEVELEELAGSIAFAVAVVMRPVEVTLQCARYIVLRHEGKQ